MIGKRLALSLLTASIGIGGCSCAQKAGCSSCRTAQKPTASIVKETTPVTESAPGVAVVAARPAIMPEAASEAQAAPPPAPLPKETLVESKPVMPSPVPVVVSAKSDSTKPMHSADYRELVGELHRNSRTGEWRLRYAGPEVEDTYGGSVTLKDVNRLMTGYSSGQMARIRGELEDRNARNPSPMYNVHSIMPVQPN